MPKNRKGNTVSKAVGFIALGLAGLALLISVLLRGKNVAMLHPKGMISHEQVSLMTFSIVLLLAVAIPVVALLYVTAWKYRASNSRAVYAPNTRYGKVLDFGAWLVPALFMAVLAVVMWFGTHRLEPQKHIVNGKKPLTIQVVSMPWKWLFIYPEQRIATVNYVQLPLDTPVEFQLTADEAPMSSFWIPNLGGQLYTMTGMVNRLNLIANTPGDYPGSSAEINGAGFAEMKFTAHVSTDKEFQDWIHEVRTSPDSLTNDVYAALTKPGVAEKQYYAFASPGLYNTIVMKYMGHTGSGGVSQRVGRE